MKRSLALVPATLLVLSLAACSAGDDKTETSPDGEACAPSGDVSSAITVEGDFGSSVKLTSEAPLAPEKLERSVLIEGDGEALKSQDEVRTQLSIFNGTTGEVVQEASAALGLADGYLGWVGNALRCANVGDRVVVTAPVPEMLDGNDASASNLPNITNDDSLVVVVDILELAPAAPGTLEDSELLKKAEGTAQEPPAGAPTVKLDADGAPTITIPEGVEPPTELTIHTLITGEGEEVQEGDRVYVHYRGVIWRTGEEFDSSWKRGSHTDFITTEVIGGFSDALVGQRVGSQVMSIVPASQEQGGYGADSLVAQGNKEDDVMVFVLDILGTVHSE